MWNRYTSELPNWHQVCRQLHSCHCSAATQQLAYERASYRSNVHVDGSFDHVPSIACALASRDRDVNAHGYELWQRQQHKAAAAEETEQQQLQFQSFFITSTHARAEALSRLFRSDGQHASGALGNTGRPSLSTKRGASNFDAWNGANQRCQETSNSQRAESTSTTHKSEDEVLSTTTTV